MDLVRGLDGRTPESIIRNFDLSFCMNWYDGENLYVMHKAALDKQEIGHLNYSYVPIVLGIKNNAGALKKNMVSREKSI